MSVDAEGNLKTLYETPSGVNPEKWTNFLSVLDRENCESLRQYAVSSMVRGVWRRGHASHAQCVAHA
ncbi:hypothetical protein [Burkholderia contaminans]|uniref:hypothetical protein n=1 Tax=Burkholderia contaminans TaxID=488447 RepID=UPI00163B193F|nr:hypothetical protein [Burkholderia contaminans]